MSKEGRREWVVWMDEYSLTKDCHSQAVRESLGWCVSLYQSRFCAMGLPGDGSVRLEAELPSKR